MVLDPFCGTGTTLVEAKLQNIPSIGVEANPFAHFASSVKIDWRIDSTSLMNIAKEIKDYTNCEIEKYGITDTPSAKNLEAISLRKLSTQQALQTWQKKILRFLIIYDNNFCLVVSLLVFLMACW